MRRFTAVAGIVLAVFVGGGALLYRAQPSAMAESRLPFAGIFGRRLLPATAPKQTAAGTPDFSLGADVLADGGPPAMLWAWEEPEDLRGLDTRRAGVAFLAERIFLGRDARIVPRRQPILTPKDVYAVAVARIEIAGDFADSPELRAGTAAALLHAAALPGIRGVQVDFDAVASQREFYTGVLRRVRAGLPAGLGLTMTALASWCSVTGGWLATLPVDAAVPMEFRLGEHVGNWEIREPKCRGSMGWATDEPMRGTGSGSSVRIYLFAPRPWTANQVARVNESRFASELVAETGGRR